MSGIVTVDDAGVATGSGAAYALYLQIEDQQTAANPLPDPDSPDDDWEDGAPRWRATMLPLIVKIKRSWAREAQAHANVLSGAPAKYLSVDATTTSNALGASPLTFAVKAGQTNMFVAELMVSCSGVGGVKLAVDVPAGSTMYGSAIGCVASATAFQARVLDTDGTSPGAWATVASTPLPVRVVVVVVAAIDGDVTLLFGSTTNGQTSTLRATSVALLTALVSA